MALVSGDASLPPTSRRSYAWTAVPGATTTAIPAAVHNQARLVESVLGVVVVSPKAECCCCGEGWTMEKMGRDCRRAGFGNSVSANATVQCTTRNTTAVEQRTRHERTNGDGAMVAGARDHGFGRRCYAQPLRLSCGRRSCNVLSCTVYVRTPNCIVRTRSNTNSTSMYQLRYVPATVRTNHRTHQRTGTGTSDHPEI